MGWGGIRRGFNLLLEVALLDLLELWGALSWALVSVSKLCPYLMGRKVVFPVWAKIQRRWEFAMRWLILLGKYLHFHCWLGHLGVWGVVFLILAKTGRREGS